MKHYIIGIAVLFLSISASAQKYDISKSWQDAVVLVPGNIFTKTVYTVTVDKPMPVVILMHGCSGIQQHETQWAHFLKSQGYIVVLPDSFAIPGRVMNCDSSSNTPNLGLVPVKRIRPAEVEYTMLQLRKEYWVDKNNIFLMGHSEGAMAAANSPELGFNAVVISSFICNNGVGASITTPVMAISYESDPYFVNKNYMCKDKWGDRPNAKQIVLSGHGHATSQNTIAKQEVVAFLKQHLK